MFIQGKFVAGVATALPTVGSAPLLVLATAKLIAGFNGAAIRTQRISDDVEADIPFIASGYMDLATAAAAPAAVKTWYDQAGAANDVVQATKANQPSVFTDAVFYGAPAISMDSLNGITTGNVNKLLTNAASLSVDNRNFSIFVVAAPHYSFNGHSYLSGGAGANGYSLYTSSANLGFTGRAGNSISQSNAANMMPKTASPNVMCWNSGATARSFRMNGVKQAVGGAGGIVTSTGIDIGSGAGNGATFGAREDLFAVIIYPLLSDADCALVEAALMKTYPVIINQPNKYVFDGDSRTQGMGDGHNPWVKRVARSLGDSAAFVVNMGVGGVTLSTKATNVSTLGPVPLYDATRTKNILVMGGIGINDFNADRTAVQMQADFITYTTACKSAGYKIVAATCPPSQAMLTARNTERVAYNTWLRANYATYSDALVDLDANASLGTWNATYYTDFAHSTPVGHTLWASLFLPAIAAL